MAASSASAASTLLDLDPPTNSSSAAAAARPCWFPEDSSLVFSLVPSSSLRLVGGFERASTVIARARVAGAALR